MQMISAYTLGCSCLYCANVQREQARARAADSVPVVAGGAVFGEPAPWVPGISTGTTGGPTGHTTTNTTNPSTTGDPTPTVWTGHKTTDPGPFWHQYPPQPRPQEGPPAPRAPTPPEAPRPLRRVDLTSE